MSRYKRDIYTHTDTPRHPIQRESMLRINRERNPLILSGLNNRLNRKNWNDTEKIGMAPARMTHRECSGGHSCSSTILCLNRRSVVVRRVVRSVGRVSWRTCGQSALANECLGELEKQKEAKRGKQLFRESIHSWSGFLLTQSWRGNPVMVSICVDSKLEEPGFDPGASSLRTHSTD